jgi:hypothetical protein
MGNQTRPCSSGPMIAVFGAPRPFGRGRALPRGPEVARAPEPRLAAGLGPFG